MSGCSQGVNVVNIAVAGTGFVGLTQAAVCAESGHRVIAYDTDAERVTAYSSGDRARIERYVNEPGLSECVVRNLGRNLVFTTDPDLLGEEVEVIFLCLPTPPQRNGATDCSQYLAGVRQIAKILAWRRSSGRVVVANKSTVPIGTTRYLETILREHGVSNVGVASNPEFLPQGAALSACRGPDRVVLGADCEEDLKLLRRVYARFPRRSGVSYIETTPETAEAIKYVANALLLTYISFWNGVGARLAEEFGDIDMNALKHGVTEDVRISPWGSHVSNGAGGSCFGKDIRSLIHQLESKGCDANLLREIYQVNEFQKTYLLDRAVEEAGFCFNNKSVAVLGLAFKCNTNDMRDSSALRVIESLLARGVGSIRAHDPLVDAHTARSWLDPSRNHLFGRVTYHRTVEEALRGSNALFISTEWEEYRATAAILQRSADPPYLIMDGRRMVSEEDAAELIEGGYLYLPVGGSLRGLSVARRSVRRAASEQAA
jgi:UDPglucose 6-dehydrogenase